MWKASIAVFLATSTVYAASEANGPASMNPAVAVTNGSYSGVYNSHYDQDFFLGIPYAQVSLLAIKVHHSDK
jgi:cholinesterase